MGKPSDYLPKKPPPRPAPMQQPAPMVPRSFDYSLPPTVPPQAPAPFFTPDKYPESWESWRMRTDEEFMRKNPHWKGFGLPGQAQLHRRLFPEQYAPRLIKGKVGGRELPDTDIWQPQPPPYTPGTTIWDYRPLPPRPSILLPSRTRRVRSRGDQAIPLPKLVRPPLIDRA